MQEQWSLSVCLPVIKVILDHFVAVQFNSVKVEVHAPHMDPHGHRTCRVNVSQAQSLGKEDI